MNNMQAVSSSSGVSLNIPNREIQDLGKILKDFISFYEFIKICSIAVGEEDSNLVRIERGEDDGFDHLKPELNAMLEGRAGTYPNIGSKLVEFMDMWGEEAPVDQFGPGYGVLGLCASSLVTEGFRLVRPYRNPSPDFFQTLTQNQISDIREYFKNYINRNFLYVIDAIYSSSMVANNYRTGRNCNEEEEKVKFTRSNVTPTVIEKTLNYISSTQNILAKKAFDELSEEYDSQWQAYQNVRNRNSNPQSTLSNTQILQRYRQVRDENRAQLQQLGL
jgi:hypothetical protein